ncbi:C40 family peptidase [uncultured Bacteroides sp.]|uniref:C40 family peptidase n=1 Tax=uncultured Bacteroides sp. TaxID=162156 RepID=UPI002AA858BC|nr:C40 family peptidase [uncultured Bacteroides sp.]
MKKNIPLLLLLLAVSACVGTADKNEKKLPGEITELADSVRKQFIPDKRVAVLDADYVVSAKHVLLKGVTTSAEAKSALLSGLKKEKYQVTDSLLLLPDSAGLEGKVFGIVDLSVCNLRAEPDFSSEMTTQALLGMPVKVLQSDGWLRIQTPDNYIAWVHRAGVYSVTKQEYDAWNRTDKIVVTAHYGFTYQKPDDTSQSVSDVVAGNRLKWEGTEGSYYKVVYPDGRQAYIAKSLSMPEKEWKATVKQDASSIIRTAYTLMGVPYLWAGMSSKGADCSGFVRNVLFMHNIIIPRDASQQAYVGQHIDIAPDFGNVQPGDLIFFGHKATIQRKEHVSHVAIYIGNKKFIHSLGDVHVSSFNPVDKDYDEYDLNRMLFAVRILNGIGTPGINTTDTNPYYNN